MAYMSCNLKLSAQRRVNPEGLRFYDAGFGIQGLEPTPSWKTHLSLFFLGRHWTSGAWRPR